MSSTPYFSSRKVYTRPPVNFQAAAGGNKQELQRALETLTQRVGSLETRSGGGSISLSSSQPISTPPSAAKVAVNASNGVFRVQITNPQYLLGNKTNTPNTPVLHRIEFSSTADFAQSEALPVSSQTYVENSQYGVSRKFIRVSSSFDGHTFGKPVISGPHSS